METKNFSDLTNNKQRAAYIKTKIMTNNYWFVKAIIEIYKQQTPEEKEIDATVESNKFGFDAFDAPILSVLAELFIKHNVLDKLKVDPKHNLRPYCQQTMLNRGLEYFRRRTSRYSGQLMKLGKLNGKYESAINKSKVNKQAELYLKAKNGE